MIRSISLENFKSWKQIRDMRFAPITGLFGANSSGKTSILQWLLMQKQTVESGDRAQVLDFGVANDERDYVELGTFRDAVYEHNESNTLSWEIIWTNSEKKTFYIEPLIEQTICTNEDLSFACKVAENSGQLLVSYLQYRWGETRYWFSKSKDNNTFSATIPGESLDFFYPNSEKLIDDPPIEKCYRFSQQIKSKSFHGESLRYIEEKYEQLTRQISYLGPLRSHPYRDYRWGGSRPLDVGQKGERVVEALLASRDFGLPPFENGTTYLVELKVAEWLKKLRLIDSFEINLVSEASRLYQVEVRKTSDSPPVLITDVGFGISQILPVIVLCYYVPKGSIIIFEQPEIHLHPSAQSGLADVFIDAIKTRGIQIILESHSEHLLRRLQRRIAEEKLSTDDVALYFCEYERDQSHFKELEVDLYGNIKNWPVDFFGDMMGDVSAMTIAAMDRILKDKGVE